MRRHALDEVVVGVRVARAHRRQPREARVLREAERDAVLRPELLELGHHRLGDARDALGVQAVHQRAVDVELVLDREVDEVGVDEHAVRRAERRVVREEEARRRLRDRAHRVVRLLLRELRREVRVVRTFVLCAIKSARYAWRAAHTSCSYRVRI